MCMIDVKRVRKDKLSGQMVDSDLKSRLVSVWPLMSQILWTN